MGTGIVLIGAGGLARECIEAARAGDGPPVEGLLDDDPAKQGQLVGGVPVVGTTAAVVGLDPATPVVAAVANVVDPWRRHRLVRRLAPGRWGSVVHPRASLAPSASVGEGSIVLAGVVATADVEIGRHCVIMPNCVLTHDVSLGEGVTLAASVAVAGGVRIEDGAYLGAGCTVREGLTVGAGAVVGTGSVVLRPVPAGETWVGNPARRLGAS